LFRQEADELIIERPGNCPLPAILRGLHQVANQEDHKLGGVMVRSSRPEPPEAIKAGILAIIRAAAK